MKIQSLEIKDYSPIKNIKIDNLGSVVIIAGANGAGKTRLKDAISQTLRGSAVMSLNLTATREEEVVAFGGNKIETIQGGANNILENYINSRRFGNRAEYVGSFVQIDSQRNIKTTKYNPVNHLVNDPDDQETPSNFYHNPFTNRWQDFTNYIHNKVASYKGKLADETAKGSLHSKEILKKYPNPFDKYKELFAKLLPGKELQDIDPVSPKEFQYKNLDNNILPFSSLSSGEQEVVKVIFDIARKDIKHSVIIVDEPELHLHPTLTFRLIETLKSTGDHTNQFIFLTHSADLISTYYSTGDVYFIDSIQTGANQAHKLSDLDHNHKDISRLIGANLGLLAVGKKIIFVEGESASIDRLTYHSIAQNVLQEAKIAPIGSVENIIALNSIGDQIEKSIFGIDFYMIRDRDGLSEVQIKNVEKNGKIKCLKKRHLENYFLDPKILFQVTKKLYLSQPNITEDFIEKSMKTIAEQSLSYILMQNIKDYLKLNCHFDIPTIKSVEKEDLDMVKSKMLLGVEKSLNDLSSKLSNTELTNYCNNEVERLQKSLQDGSWKNEFHGKIIFSKLCSEIFHTASQNQVRAAYVDIVIETKSSIFDDIINIFKTFA